ncbi:hypothetical protein TcCL_Unassigned05600, partial [Trypanosoma cruzi]
MPTHPRTRQLRLNSLKAHDTSTGTTTASASPDTCPGLPAAANTRTSSSSTRAQGTTRRRTITFAVIIARSGVAGFIQLIGETERKRMEREGEGRSTADTARERRQHEERAAGPAAQFTHHETASTQGRHTTPAATHHCRRRRHPSPSPPAHSRSPREMAKTPRPPHNAHGRR